MTSDKKNKENKRTFCCAELNFMQYDNTLTHKQTKFVGKNGKRKKKF